MSERVKVENCSQSPVPLESGLIHYLAYKPAGEITVIRCEFSARMQSFCVSRPGDVYCLNPDTPDSTSGPCNFRRRVLKQMLIELNVRKSPEPAGEQVFYNVP